MNLGQSASIGSGRQSGLTSAGTAASPRAMIRTVGLEKTYVLSAENTVRALRGVDLEITQGSYVAVMGPSGSGKSTVLNLLGCLDRPSAGNYFLGGQGMGAGGEPGAGQGFGGGEGQSGGGRRRAQPE